MEKVALITGAGSGIGKACALALADAGWSLALCGRRLERVSAVCDEAKAKGASAVAAQADVGDPAAVETLWKPGSGGSTCCSTTPARARRPSRWKS
jgi:NADP-dependent 3-hydroxy acid dehydrogenase YdfG